MEIDKEKYIKFISDSEQYDCDCGERSEFTPSQLVPADEIDDRYDELFSLCRQQANEVERLRKILIEAIEIIKNLSARHEWSDNFDDPCICKEHVAARDFLKKVEADD